MTVLEDYLSRGAAELGIEIPPEQLKSFRVYGDELIKWNRKINLTAIIRPEEIAIKHFIDSLALGKLERIGGSLLDIGSGGGFPAIPLKIQWPDVRIVSVDAVEKKINFQRHVARTLGLTGFTALHCRVENLPAEYGGTFACVVSRAFAELTDFVKCALPWLAESGVIIAMKGKDGKGEATEAAEEFDRMGLWVESVREFCLPLFGDGRSLIRIRRKM